MPNALPTELESYPLSDSKGSPLEQQEVMYRGSARSGKRQGRESSEEHVVILRRRRL
jgi:hypothetical protein